MKLSKFVLLVKKFTFSKNLVNSLHTEATWLFVLHLFPVILTNFVTCETTCITKFNVFEDVLLTSTFSSLNSLRVSLIIIFVVHTKSLSLDYRCSLESRASYTATARRLYQVTSEIDDKSSARFFRVNARWWSSPFCGLNDLPDLTLHGESFKIVRLSIKLHKNKKERRKRRCKRHDLALRFNWHRAIVLPDLQNSCLVILTSTRTPEVTRSWFLFYLKGWHQPSSPLYTRPDDL